MKRRRFPDPMGRQVRFRLGSALPNMNLTETGMSTLALAPAAQDEIATLFVGLELSKSDLADRLVFGCQTPVGETR